MASPTRRNSPDPAPASLRRRDRLAVDELGRVRPRHAACLALLLLLVSGIPTPIAAAPSAMEQAQEFFLPGAVHRLRLEVSPAGVVSLRQNPRRNVPAILREGDQVYTNLTVHLKGRTGSFRSVDDSPSLTLHLEPQAGRGPFHGLVKFHLNNSVEDPTFLHEAIGASLFAQAGLACPRVTHALVEFNGRRLGLYVLKEGITRRFLEQHFSQATGNLYEHVPGENAPGDWRREFGEGPDDRRDLAALEAALTETDLHLRWVRLQQILDIDRFLSFMALEILIGHRDGYCLAANNYRLYHDPGPDRFVFIPQGMDQLFGQPDLSWRPDMSGPVARSLMEIPEARQRYRARADQMFTNLIQPPALAVRIRNMAERIQPALGFSQGRTFQRQVGLLEERIRRRIADLADQFQRPEPAPISFSNGQARPQRWRPVDVPADGTLEQGLAPDRTPALRIQAGHATSASWRTAIRLEPGTYAFEGRVKVREVKPFPYGRNRGAGLRVSNVPQPAPSQLTGTSAWTPLRVEFEWKNPAEELELICELRATAGEAWFDLESLRLVRREGSGPLPGTGGPPDAGRRP